jgi:hypothetical protein
MVLTVNLSYSEVDREMIASMEIDGLSFWTLSLRGTSGCLQNFVCLRP